jgi:hypothetical protein
MTIKPLTKRLVYTLSFTFLLFLAACGGDASAPTKLSPQAHKVTVTIGLNGSAATMIGSVDLTVVLPAGFVLETDSSGQPTGSTLSFLVEGAEIAGANYIPAANGDNGKILAAFAKSSGFAGDANLVQISRIYPANATLPTEDNFIITVVANDTNPTNTTVVNGISAKISISTELVP